MDTMTPETTSPIDTLHASMRRSGSIACVGLDPVLERLPESIDRPDPVDAIRSFSMGVVEAVAPHVAAIKVQSACFERFGPTGVQAMKDVLAAIPAHGAAVILDAKRGDIGISAHHYAAAASAMGAHWVTVNGYLGMDGVEPFLEQCGAFVLVRTSNPGSSSFQDQRLADGRTVAESMADHVASLAAGRIGPSGWSDVGAVVGATHPTQAHQLRERLRGVTLLVPGIGAQGGTIEDCRPLCGDDGLGALLTASRSVIYVSGGDNWSHDVREAAKQLAHDTGVMAGLR
ncbi:MAG TPA: orotidine-5'-phosphate decarboxylase [Phycisphaerales bacterium]|nr:orotidine-5'-phosphate decarboxylase [Phycisphaerales bacterium]